MDKHKLEQLRYAIRSQFDYYFGDANYAKDNFLRSQADDDGLVAKFNRVRELTEDFEAVQRSLESSAIVEVSECGEYADRATGEVTSSWCDFGASSLRYINAILWDHSRKQRVWRIGSCGVGEFD
eukprot:s2857_g2.t1